MNSLGLSRKFLERVLGKPVESFSVQPGTNTGDNFMSVLYAVEAKVTSEDPEIFDCNNNINEETVHLLCKCFPVHPGAQEFLIRGNIFWKELSIYINLIPEMTKFQFQLGMKEILKPNLPPLINGRCMNFKRHRGNKNMLNKLETSSPMDNYLLMVDIRKTWGFRMSSRHRGLDYAHVSLAIEALAKVHAISWAYKQKYNLDTLASKFPFIYYDLQQDKDTWDYMLDNHLTQTLQILKEKFGEESPEYKRTKVFQKISSSISDVIFEKTGTTASDLEFFLRKSPQKMKESEKPWRVLIHGDCWVNNMLFRYNDHTNEPEEVTLVDLQMSRESCPTTDLIYLIYTSTDSFIRRKYLDSMLELYVDKFNSFCNLLQCETLPGFNLQSLTRRFNRAKLLGYCVSVVSLPIMLQPPCPSTLPARPINSEVEEVCLNLNLNQRFDTTPAFSHPTYIQESETTFERRIIAIAQEFCRDGVI